MGYGVWGLGLGVWGLGLRGFQGTNAGTPLWDLRGYSGVILGAAWVYRGYIRYT